MSLENLTNKMEHTAHQSDSGKTSKSKNGFAIKVNHLLDSKAFSTTMSMASLIALFIFDINLAFLPPSADVIIVWIVVICCVLFTVEIALSMYAKPNYFLSFFFFLDVVGSLSLVPDIVESLFNLSTSGSTNNDLQVARAGKVGRLARTAGSLRVSRFSRLVRVVRLVRVGRIFRILQSKMQTGLKQKMDRDKEKN